MSQHSVKNFFPEYRDFEQQQQKGIMNNDQNPKMHVIRRKNLFPVAPASPRIDPAKNIKALIISWKLCHEEI